MNQHWFCVKTRTKSFGYGNAEIFVSYLHGCSNVVDDSMITSPNGNICHFPRYWPLVRGIHRSSVNYPHKGQWRGASVFPLTCAWINGWVNKRVSVDLGRHGTHCDVIIMLRTWTQNIDLKIEQNNRLSCTFVTNVQLSRLFCSIFRSMFAYWYRNVTVAIWLYFHVCTS